AVSEPLPAAEPVPVAEPFEASGPGIGSVSIIQGDNLAVARTLPSASFTLVYLDPPFNTGRAQERQVVTARRSLTTPEDSPAKEVRHGFHGHEYERVRGMLRTYDDRFDDYGDFLMPRLEEAWRL